MRYQLGFAVLVSLLVVACSKDSVETKPSIKVKSVSSQFVQINNDLSINLEFTDKEADLASVFVQKIRQNRRTTATVSDSFSLNVADFPKKNNGEIELRLFYQLQLISAITPPALPGSPTGFESDSLVFRLALRDKAANVSDTVTTQLVVVERIN